jgi:hypothetical protein
MFVVSTMIKINSLKEMFLKQQCIQCGVARGWLARRMSDDASLCDECLHNLQHASRQACRHDSASQSKKAE